MHNYLPYYDTGEMKKKKKFVPTALPCYTVVFL